MAGPGFESARQIQEIVGVIDTTPTLLDAAGVRAPASMKGMSFMPLVSDAKARAAWPNRQLVQISESMTGRAIRTKEFTYCVADPSGRSAASSASYHEYQMYDQRNDPYELVNVAGRQEYASQAAELRGELKKMMVASGEAEPEIVPAKLYP